MDWHSWECSETKKDLWVRPLEGWASSSPHWKGGDPGKVQPIWSKLPGTILFLPDLLELILIKKRKIFPLKTNLTTCPKSIKAKEPLFCVRAHFLWFSFKRIWIIIRAWWSLLTEKQPNRWKRSVWRPLLYRRRIRWERMGGTSSEGGGRRVRVKKRRSCSFLDGW